ncbi:hypothetical protein [Rhodovulum sulfidophilum]|uniref:hypothetical protein n=1 Tax=Rhodovulum sulfidophilum TaxID=35806 RepID=UPI003075E44A
MALRRKVSKSAIVEAKVMSYLSGDSADRLETVMSRRLDKLGRQIDTLDLDLAAAYGSRTIRCTRQRRGAVRGLHAEARPASGDGRQVPQRDVARPRLTSGASISRTSPRAAAIKSEYSGQSCLLAFAADCRRRLDTC